MKILTKKKYAKCKNWVDTEKLKIYVHPSWNKLFEQLNEKDELNIIFEKLKKCKNPEDLYPYPKYLFYAFKLTSFEKLKVVILGQDPYFDVEMYNEVKVPQAMGLSFSVPKNFNIPSSLQNIYKNLLKFKHIDEIPKTGNLEYLARRGVLFLNTSLSVLQGSSNKKCHSEIWKNVTNNILNYISNNKDHLVFVLWGSDALNYAQQIDSKKHKFIISSHPSGFSANNKLKHYPSFNENDHFGEINNYLIKFNKKPIKWKIK